MYNKSVHRDRDFNVTSVQKKREELESHVDAVHRDGDYQCDKCDFEAIINKLMFKQFVVVIPNVLTIVNKNIFIRDQRIV